MSRVSLFRWWKAGIVALTIVLLGWSIATRPVSELQTALFFAALVLVATFLRIEGGDATVGFEAAVVFGALIIFHSPFVALLAVFLGCAAHGVYLALKEKRLSIDPFYNASQLALSYTIVGLLYSVAVAEDAKPAAKMAGFVLLLVGYLVTHLLFVSIRRYFEEETAPLDFRRVLTVHGKTLVLITPVVAIEVMLYARSEEHTSELQSQSNLVCRLLLEKKK